MTKDDYAGGPITGVWRDEEERRAIRVGDGRGGWGGRVIGWTWFDVEELSGWHSLLMYCLSYNCTWLLDHTLCWS